MEDIGIVSKNKIFALVFLALIIIGLLVYFYWNRKSENTNNNSNNNQNNTNPSSNDYVNQNGIYGKFVNIEDPNSYFEINENESFTFVMNICEGYLPYTEENYSLNKNITKDSETLEYNIKLTITAKSTSEGPITFNASLVDATGLVVEYTGPYSCSPSYNYKRI